jgi:hypothetical protein
MTATLFSGRSYVRILPALITIYLFNCTPIRYSYKTSMQPGNGLYSLLYENDTMKIQFALESKKLGFRIDNKLSDAIVIRWDEASLSINGIAYKITHTKNEKFIIVEYQPPSSIPPQSFIKDGYTPVSNIQYSTNGSEQIFVSDLFPSYNNGNTRTRKKINSLKGCIIVAYLPFYVHGSYESKSFKFIIEDIKAQKASRWTSL